MVENEEAQATALDAHWAALDAGEPPRGLDPALAVVVRLLRDRLLPEPPREAFIAGLRRQVEERASATAGWSRRWRHLKRRPPWAAVGVGTGSLVVLSLGMLVIRARRHGAQHAPQL
jgi:hypothetical protein